MIASGSAAAGGAGGVVEGIGNGGGWMKDGMTAEEAREYIEFNIEGAYMGPDTPILVWMEDLWDEDYDE